ncbi:MAG: hypothetical protein KBG35_09250 [Thauera sp.]|nr:hypothetical protein [Thauera sp.]
MIRIRTQFSAVARRRSLVSGLFAAVLASAILPAHAQTEDAAARAAERARAEALEADGKALRAEAEATYEATVPGCYDRFFVNRCIDQAKKKRLETVKRARELEAESRRITLAERQRVAAEAGAKAERPLTPATPTALPATSPAAVSAPSPDTRIAPSPEAERIRAEREAATRAAETEAARSRAANDAQRAADRRQAEADAASRAQQAAEDRARYDERIRKYEEEQAKKKQ